jgi:hypothetical protein
MFVLSSGPGVISPESVSLFTILDLSIRADFLTPARREASRLQHNLTNPLRRDTITVAPGTWRVVRVITDIPGTLLFHCHIVWRKHTVWQRHPSRLAFDMFLLSVLQIKSKDFSASFSFSRNAFNSFRSRKTT